MCGVSVLMSFVPLSIVKEGGSWAGVLFSVRYLHKGTDTNRGDKITDITPTDLPDGKTSTVSMSPSELLTDQLSITTRH